VRAVQEIDGGRRGRGDGFGAFCPATGAAFAAPSPGRTIAGRADVPERVDARLAAAAPRVDAILDNPSTHRALDVLPWAPTHPRWGSVFPPTYAACPNPTGPWWETLRSLALQGRRCANGEGVRAAVAAATAYRNRHRHPSVGGRRRQRRRAARRAGLAQLPLAA